MRGYIYGLVDPTTGAIHYIGASIDPEGRLQSHIQRALTSPWKIPENLRDWILDLDKSGVRPTIKILEETDADLRFFKELIWIQIGLSKNWPLKNIDGISKDKFPELLMTKLQRLIFNERMDLVLQVTSEFPELRPIVKDYLIAREELKKSLKLPDYLK